jgi:hypothetical protein
MGVRMFLPLGALLLVWLMDRALLTRGFLPNLIVAYLLVLGLETVFACLRVRATQPMKGRANHGW